ncbi:15170_t:CDS:2 [Acaulospora morrowiae]|uniref:15170_t:CDS:1 n=1 Tax=Acaulospora morrowiae TaxID=94023 RepID=A0A9N9G5V4_9GLOM|nr:15170_t:CDS:2 [Acaulospora morrowiae]
MLISGLARVAQIRHSLRALFSLALLQAKQKLNFDGVFRTQFALETGEPSENDQNKKRIGREMPVKPNYRAPRLPIVLCHGNRSIGLFLFIFFLHRLIQKTKEYLYFYAYDASYNEGLFGFDKLGPASIPYLQIRYWGSIQEALQKLGAKVIVTKVPRTGCVRSRAQTLHHTLETTLPGMDVNLLAHSMGGLDCRYLIAHLPTRNCTVRSLTTISTPHCGSAFMDWCRDNFGVGVKSVEAASKAVDDALTQITQKTRNLEISNTSEQRSPENREEKNTKSDAKNKKSFSIPILNFTLPDLNFNLSLPNINLPSINLSSIPQTTSTLLHPVTRSIIQALDTPAYSNLTTDYCTNYFNPNTPNNPSVAYYSYGAAIDIPIWSPLYFPYQIIKAKDGPNDGLVSVKSAQWGRYVKTVECDHWDLTDRWRIKFGSNFDPVEFYISVATFLAAEGY